jgi:hypothetical protein
VRDGAEWRHERRYDLQAARERSAALATDASLRHRSVQYRGTRPSTGAISRPQCSHHVSGSRSSRSNAMSCSASSASVATRFKDDQHRCLRAAMGNNCLGAKTFGRPPTSPMGAVHLRTPRLKTGWNPSEQLTNFSLRKRCLIASCTRIHPLGAVDVGAWNGYRGWFASRASNWERGIVPQLETPTATGRDSSDIPLAAKGTLL